LGNKHELIDPNWTFNSTALSQSTGGDKGWF